MIIERRGGVLYADLLWDDLSDKAQAELLELMDGDNGNYDVFPFASINVSGEDGGG